MIKKLAEWHAVCNLFNVTNELSPIQELCATVENTPMSQIKNILVTTDLSGNANKAFTFAAAMARQHGARLHLVYVSEPPLYVTDDMSTATAAMQNAVELEQRNVAEFDALMKKYQQEHSDIDIQPIKRTGAPAKEIVAAAVVANADCIVMATHGRTGLERFLAGSVTEDVIRSSSCPVLCINTQAVPVIGLRDIVLPTDFSANSQFAYNFALNLAKQNNVALHLVCVIEDKLMVAPSLAPNNDSAEWLLFDHQQTQAKLTALAAQLATDSGVQVVPVVRHGDPAAEILAVARQTQSSLIVTATHGRSGFSRLLMGSVAEKLVRQSPIPVFCLRPPELSDSYRQPQAAGAKAE